MTASRAIAMIGRIVSLAPMMIGVAVMGCGDGSLPEGATDPQTGRSSAALSYDCTVTQETGYTDGNAFAIEVVTVAGYPVEIHTADALLTMMEAAEKDGVELILNDGFRTYDEQAYYYNCSPAGCCCCNGCNPAAAPGYSNHQSGHAIDFDMGGNRGAWIFANAPSFGWSNDEGASVGEDWHWTWWGGGSPKAFCANSAPTGSLDGVGCDTVSGWAFDTEAGAAAIEAHLYYNGPAGSASAHGVALQANQQRDDLCSVVGSCNHGFSMSTPLSLLDGANHEVHVYGIDSAGGTNPELSNSPKTLNCTGTLPAGVARWIPNPDIYTAWKFDDFQDILPIAKATVDAIPKSTDVPAAPVLAAGPSGGKVYLIDGTLKRHVPSPAVMDAWRLDWNAIQTKTDAEMAAFTEGPAVRNRPVIVSDSAGKLLLIDDEVAGSTGGAGGGGSAGAGGASHAGAGGGAAAGAGGGGFVGVGGGAAGVSADGGVPQSWDEASESGSCAVAQVPVRESGYAGIALLVWGMAAARGRGRRAKQTNARGK